MTRHYIAIGRGAYMAINLPKEEDKSEEEE